jgi:hypothetical protein
MIKHIVTFKFAGDADVRRESSATAKRELESLTTLVPGVASLVVGIDPATAETHWDAVLVSDFENEADLGAYQVHSEHVRVAALVGSLTESRSIVDYEY